MWFLLFFTPIDFTSDLDSLILLTETSLSVADAILGRLSLEIGLLHVHDGTKYLTKVPLDVCFLEYFPLIFCGVCFFSCA